MKKYYSREEPKVTISKLTIIYLVTLSMLFLIDISLTILIFIFFFSAFIIYAIWNAIKNEPTVIIDSTFIKDNSHLNSCGKVKWEEIKHIEIKKVGNKNFLCFDLVDENKILSKKNVLARFMMKNTKKKLGTIFMIPDISVNESLEVLLTETLKLKQLNKQQQSIKTL